MKVQLVEFNSNKYQEMIALRVEALLSPIGIPASYIVPENEKNDVFIGAFEKDKLIGCCILTKRDETTVQLRQMAVHPSWQGKGVGASIVKFAEETARSIGYKILMMHARNPVLEFYQKSGYVIVGEEFFEVGMGHHQMQKVL